MPNRIYTGVLILLVGALFSCSNHSPVDENSNQTGEVITPVTVTHIKDESMSSDIMLNATSVFQQKSIVKSNISGYIQKEMINPGQLIHKGQLLFVMKTKEAHAIDGGQAIDSTLKFSGIIPINSSQSGYVSQLDHQQGDYVLDGDQLCIIADLNSFVFILDVPFELSPYVKTGHSCDIILPDGRHITGRIDAKIPAVDPVTQTQRYIVKISPRLHLPENLIVKISFTKSTVRGATVLPRASLLTNEGQTQWWVMKMINDSMAVKVPVQKGLESDTSVQIISPRFSDTDKILVSGNYGLADTAFVKIER